MTVGQLIAALRQMPALLARPCDEQPGMERYEAAPPVELRDLEIGCSS